jgi:antitoxin CptB
MSDRAVNVFSLHRAQESPANKNRQRIMTGDAASSPADKNLPPHPLELIRRRIRVRAWRRGMREMDIILGGFADARLDTLEPEELAQFEALLDADDDVAFSWFCAGTAPAPYDTPLFRKIAVFQAEKDKDL